MGSSEQTESVLRFQDFQVNLQTGELWKAGIRLKLQDQPFKVLAALLQHPGQVVTREELHHLIWPQESFGDFDHAINLAVNKLRNVLGDSAEVPHLIETLPRRGYRFIAPLEGHPAPKPDTALPVPKRWSKFATNWTWLAVGSAALILVCTVALLRLVHRPAEPSSFAVEVVPLISMEGKQRTPSFSPDGNQVAFRVYGGPHPGIYTTLIGGEKPLQLTSNPMDVYPTWSPDGRQIAFARYTDSGYKKSFYVISALGGSEHLIYTGQRESWDTCGHIDWSPDGTTLMFTEAAKDGSTSGISLLLLSDLTTRQITSAGNWEYDCEPVFSPDGASIAFVRGTMGSDFRGDLFVVKTAGGDPTRLTSGNSSGEPAWTRDGKEIVFASSMGGLRTLYRIPSSGGTPRPIAGISGTAYQPSISRKGNQLVYRQVIQNDTIWRLSLKDERHAFGPPVRLLYGRGFVWKPSFSPDGKKIAFESDRLGFCDIWTCDSDGSHCAPLTSMHSWSDTARWSPEGRYIVFEAITGDYYQVYVVEVSVGAPRLVSTFPNSTNGVPNWSRDGQWIYFYSIHEKGNYELWKVPFKGGAPVLVTGDGVYGTESHDGHFLYLFKAGQPGVWKMPIDGREETRVLDQPGYWNDWALAPSGIYYLNRDFQPNGRIEFFDFVTRATTPIFALEKPASDFGGVTLSPDGKSLLFGQRELDESYIMLVKNFR